MSQPKNPTKTEQLYEDEKYLNDNHWKIYSKASGKKFWESPHDGKVYSTAHAVLAQESFDQEQKEKDRVAKLLENEEQLEDYDKFQNWEVPIDKMFTKKGRVKKQRKKKEIKFDRDKTIKDLGF